MRVRAKIPVYFGEKLRRPGTKGEVFEIPDKPTIKVAHPDTKEIVEIPRAFSFAAMEPLDDSFVGDEEVVEVEEQPRRRRVRKVKPAEDRADSAEEVI